MKYIKGDTVKFYDSYYDKVFVGVIVKEYDILIYHGEPKTYSISDIHPEIQAKLYNRKVLSLEAPHFCMAPARRVLIEKNSQ